MFRGQRKTPCVVSTEGGCLTNENREISNLAMQITKNAQKHYLITEAKVGKRNHICKDIRQNMRHKI